MCIFLSQKTSGLKIREGEKEDSQLYGAIDMFPECQQIELRSLIKNTIWGS